MTDNTQNQAAPQPAPAPAPTPQPPPGVKVLDLGAVLNGFHTRIAALEATAKTDVSKAKAFVTKYWPIAAGAVIAVAEHFVKL